MNTFRYNAHNLYGFMESIATRNALEALQQRRSFVLSRSTFPGYAPPCLCLYDGH